jgi:nucleoside-diphosphate-sugar epimerase
MKELLIIGCGDIGGRVADLALARQIPVTGVVRSEAAAEHLRSRGIRTVIGDLDNRSPLNGLPVRGATVLYLVPPPGGGHFDPRVRVFCGSIEPGEEPEKIIYVSTSGVYGDCGGQVVTEETPPNPQTARARRRLDAESILRGWGALRRVPIVILRVTGIYGPGRYPLDRIVGGHPVLREEEAASTNRIHADDLARVCLAAAEKVKKDELFNVSDGQTGTMTEYFNAVADALAVPRPPQITMEEARRVMTPLMLSYVAESRRIDNSRMLARLGVELLYPTLAAGLQADAPQLQKSGVRS